MTGLRRAVVAACASALVAVLAGCGQPPLGVPPADPSSSAPGKPPAASPSTSGPSAPASIAPGVTLEPGDDGNLPVRVRWVQALSAPESFAVDEGTLYVADELLYAFRIRDGALTWEAGNPSGDGLAASGGVVIGLDGPDRVRVWAPWEYDLVVRRRHGDLISLRGAGGEDLPRGMTPLPAARPTRYGVRTGLKRITARRPDGAVAWRIAVDEPWYDPVPAQEVPGGLVLVTASGHLVVLDYKSS